MVEQQVRLPTVRSGLIDMRPFAGLSTRSLGLGALWHRLRGDSDVRSDGSFGVEREKLTGRLEKLIRSAGDCGMEANLHIAVQAPEYGRAEIPKEIAARR